MIKQLHAEGRSIEVYYKNTRDDIVSGLPLAINIFIKLREEILQGSLKNGEKLDGEVGSAINITSAAPL